MLEITWLQCPLEDRQAEQLVIYREMCGTRGPSECILMVLPSSGFVFFAWEMNNVEADDNELGLVLWPARRPPFPSLTEPARPSG